MNHKITYLSNEHLMLGDDPVDLNDIGYSYIDIYICSRFGIDYADFIRNLDNEYIVDCYFAIVINENNTIHVTRSLSELTKITDEAGSLFNEIESISVLEFDSIKELTQYIETYFE